MLLSAGQEMSGPLSIISQIRCTRFVSGRRWETRDRDRENVTALKHRLGTGTGLLPPYFTGCVGYSCHFSDQMSVRWDLMEGRSIRVHDSENTVCDGKERHGSTDISQGSGTLESEDPS